MAPTPTKPSGTKPFPLHPASIPTAMRPISLAARRLQELRDTNKAKRVLQGQRRAQGGLSPVTSQQAEVMDRLGTHDLPTVAQLAARKRGRGK